MESPLLEHIATDIKASSTFSHPQGSAETLTTMGLLSTNGLKQKITVFC
jgi:hypothetical protein